MAKPVSSLSELEIFQTLIGKPPQVSKLFQAWRHSSRGLLKNCAKVMNGVGHEHLRIADILFGTAFLKQTNNIEQTSTVLRILTNRTSCFDVSGND